METVEIIGLIELGVIAIVMVLNHFQDRQYRAEQEKGNEMMGETIGEMMSEVKSQFAWTRQHFAGIDNKLAEHEEKLARVLSPDNEVPQ